MKHIFLLEDDETMGRGIAMALTGMDTFVTCRSALTQARETLAEERFDLLILDVNLPDGSGLDLLRQVRTNGDATPVILLTANDLELDGRGGRLHHQAFLPGGTPGPGECPAPAGRSHGFSNYVHRPLYLRF